VVQVREIVLRMARDRGEYDRFLGSDADKMKSVESSCQRLGDSLGYSEFPAGATEKRELFGETLKIVQDLSGILGRIRARSDQEGR
jgi:hypothetical protein